MHIFDWLLADDYLFATDVSLKEPESPAKVLSVSHSKYIGSHTLTILFKTLLDDISDFPLRWIYAASLGEIAVAFDFGPLTDSTQLSSQRLRSEAPVYPLYILYEKGETYLSYMSLTFNLQV